MRPCPVKWRDTAPYETVPPEKEIPMGSKRSGIPVAAIALAALFPGAVASAETPLAGRWTGAIELPGQRLEITVQIAGSGDAWSGTIDIPAQNARNLPLSSFDVSSSAVRFSIAGVPGDPTFHGTRLPENAGVIAGQFTQGGQTFAFRLERSGAPPAVAVAAGPEGGWKGLRKEAAASGTVARKQGTKPAHPLDEYAGDYVHPVYGIITVSRDGESGMKATLHGSPVRLEHWHYETFRLVFALEDPALANEKMFVLFRTNVQGDVDALEMREIVFEKRPLP